MYEPVFNSVLVQVDDKDAQWGGGNDDSMLGKSYSKGQVIRVGTFIPKQEYPMDDAQAEIILKNIKSLEGKHIMWNEGVEAGTLFDFDAKQFAMIYWWDIRGVLVNPAEAAK